MKSLAAQIESAVKAGTIQRKCGCTDPAKCSCHEPDKEKEKGVIQRRARPRLLCSGQRTGDAGHP